MAVLYFCCFYACFSLTLAAGQPVRYVLKGKDAVLTPDLPKTPDDIVWKHNGHTVISFDSAEESVFPPYEGRVTLGWSTAELTIADVGYEDSGEYELDARIRDRMHRSQYMLKVLDKVSKPVIGCELSDDRGNSTSVRRATLLCSSDSNTPDTLTFKWNLEGKSQLGQSLNIALGDEHDHMEYSCTASNPLHAETSVYMAKDCYTAQRSSEALDIIVPIVIASLILLAFCIFPFIFRHQIKRACLNQRKNKDLEKQIAVIDPNKDEGSPLMGDIHRQETFASKQPLIQQNDCVTATPQKQENETTTSEAASPIRNGQVDSDRETDSLNELTERQSPSPSGDPRGLLSLEHEAELHNYNHEDVPKANTSGDSSSIHSDQEDASQAPEEKVQEDKDETGPETKADTEHKDPQTDSDHESVNSDSNEEHEVNSASDQPHEQDSSNEEPMEPKRPSASDDTLTADSGEVAGMAVQDNKEETGPETKPDPDHKDPQTDSDHESVNSDSNEENVKDAALTDVPHTETSEVDSTSDQPFEQDSSNEAPMEPNLPSASDDTLTADSGEVAEVQSPALSSGPEGLQPLEPETDVHNFNQDAVQKTNPADDSSSSHSDQEETVQALEEKDSPPQPQNNVLLSRQDSESEASKPVSTEQTDPDDKPTSASETKHPSTDESVTSEPRTSGESEVSSDSQPSPSEPPVQDETENTSQKDSEHKDPQTHSDPKSSDSNGEKTEDTAPIDVQPLDAPQMDSPPQPPQSGSDQDSEPESTEQTHPGDEPTSASEPNDPPTDVPQNENHNQLHGTNVEEPHKQDSPSEESEESKLTSTAVKTSTGDSEMPGSVKESAESTHQPQL